MDGGRDATGLGTGADLLIVLFFSLVFGIGEAYTAPCFCFLLFFIRFCFTVKVYDV